MITVACRGRLFHEGEPGPVECGCLARSTRRASPTGAPRAPVQLLDRHRSGQAPRWTAAGMLEAERQFRKTTDYRDLATIVVAIERDHDVATVTARPLAPRSGHDRRQRACGHTLWCWTHLFHKKPEHSAVQFGVSAAQTCSVRDLILRELEEQVT